MQLRDILAQALKNLRRRRSRTILTAIGVMIGCTSILVMVSIGQGLNENQTAMLESMGDLRTITVYNYSSDTASAITDSTLNEFRSIDHVQAVTGKLMPDNYSIQLSAMNERYGCDWAYLVGLDSTQLEDLGYTVQTGSSSISAAANNVIPCLLGSEMIYSFYDSYRPEGSNTIGIDYDALYNDSTYELPDGFFDPLETDLTLTMASYDDPEKTVRFTLRPVGILEENGNAGYETIEGIVVDLNLLKDMMKQVNQNAGLTTRESTYQEVIVKADDIANVSEVEEQLKTFGFDTTSMVSIRESLNEQSRTIQLILGGIGAISLFVAAIGITNTMIMSISERTREIGIMKALGCATKDIRMIFLCEASLIGLLGGIAGAVLSYLISMGINFFAWQYSQSSLTYWQYLFETGSRISVIPLWLLAGGLLFSLLIGLLSGSYPASKAVKIPALEAIRHE